MALSFTPFKEMIVLGLRIQLALEQHPSPIYGALIPGHPAEINILK